LLDSFQPYFFLSCYFSHSKAECCMYCIMSIRKRFSNRTNKHHTTAPANSAQITPNLATQLPAVIFPFTCTPLQHKIIRKRTTSTCLDTHQLPLHEARPLPQNQPDPWQKLACAEPCIYARSIFGETICSSTLYYFLRLS